jgi:hypothetical protein
MRFVHARPSSNNNNNQQPTATATTKKHDRDGSWQIESITWCIDLVVVVVE